jgi:tRNA (cytidine/uridine-2'-O-)-methyltransferase
MTERLITFSEPSFALSKGPNGKEVPFHVVLVEPEIPQNSGNIARLCAGTGAWLHLVEPLGYKLEDRYLRRAGLDYWPGVTLSVHPSIADLEEMLPRERTWLFSKRGESVYTDVSYPTGAVLVFGCETRGVPAEFVERWKEGLVRLPTTGNVRSLNLANTVAVGSYEVVRQQGWRGETPMPG